VSRIIVFGGSGFVGSHVADCLTEAGHEVTIFDRRVSPHLLSRQTFIAGDILDPDAVRQAVEGHSIVYNFAGNPDISRSFDAPMATMQVNVLGCANQLEAARQTGVERFVLASTLYVYSEAGGFYRVSKQACELMVQEYQRAFGLDYTILRYGSLYGRRADKTNSIHNYLSQALRQRRISVEGYPDQVREYIHVTDAARSSVAILSQQYRNEHVQLTGHQSLELRQLLRMIQEIVGHDVSIDLREPPMDSNEGHYRITPYAFRPIVGKKLITDYFSDMGQGMLDVLDEIYRSDTLPRQSSE
jgi:UDP-glucose 4-epimerase